MANVSNLGSTTFLLKQANAAPELDRELEATLVARWQAGDSRALEMLVRCHQRYVVALAMKYRHYGVAINELVAEGNVGVVHAIARFKPERGVRFGTYAAYWVRAEMLACIVKSGRAVGGSDGPLRSQMFFKLRRERARVFNLLGSGDSADRELASRLGLSLDRVQRMNQRLDARDVALDAKSTGQHATPVERLRAPDDPERELFEHQVGGPLRSSVKRALQQLDPRERRIVTARHLADPDQQLSLAELARRLDISRERARQLEARALSKLRRTLCSSPDPVLREWLQTELMTAAA
jgi:RNA polymerase sigma-32 factor